MTGKEIPGVGLAPGGKIKKEVEELLQHFLAIADAKNKKWANLAQYSILKEMLGDLHAIAEGKTASEAPVADERQCPICLEFCHIGNEVININIVKRPKV